MPPRKYGNLRLPRPHSFLRIALAVAGLLAGKLAAQTWTGTTNTTWSTATNWTGGVPGNAATATFNTITANDPNLTAAATTGKLLFSSGADAKVFTGSALTLNGVTSIGIDNQSGLVQTFNNTLILGAAQTWNAGSGDLALSAVTLGGNLTLTGGSNFTFSGTLLNNAGNRTLTNNATGTVTVGAISLSNNNTGRTLTFAGAGTTTVNGAVGNGGTAAGNVTVNNTGNVVLSAAGTYTGITTLTAGTLTVGNNTALSTGGITLTSGTLASNAGNTLSNAVTLTGNATVQNITLSGTFTESAANRTLTLDGATLSGTVNLSNNNTAHTLTANVIGGASTISGVIANGGTGAGGFTKSGTGTLTLSGASANTYTGATAVNDGVLNLNKSAGVNALGTGAITIGDGAGAASSASLVLLASNQLANTAAITLGTDGRLAMNNFTETIATIAGTGLVDLSTSGYLQIGNGNTSSSFSGTITGSGTLEKLGTGGLTFNSAINYAGSLSLAGGTLTLNGITATIGTLTLTGNTTIDFAGTAASLNVTTLNLNGFTLNVTNWTNATDYFFATNWTGAVVDTRGAAPMNQVTFNGFTAADTQWQGYDSQVTPVPEPGTYGALLVGGLSALTLWRRRLRAASMARAA